MRTSTFSPTLAVMNKNENRERPKLKIELTTVDKATELIGIIGLLTLIALPIYFFDKLPETIPRHFGANGEPDGFSGKGIIWTLPIIGIVMYVGMFWLNKISSYFQLPTTSYQRKCSKTLYDWNKND